jgi:hypothetical protein
MDADKLKPTHARDALGQNSHIISIAQAIGAPQTPELYNGRLASKPFIRQPTTAHLGQIDSWRRLSD